MHTSFTRRAAAAAALSLLLASASWVSAAAAPVPARTTAVPQAAADLPVRKLATRKKRTSAVASAHRWRPVLVEDFGGRFDDRLWWRYGGVSKASGAEFDSTAVRIADGALVLTSRKGPDGIWRGAGVGQRTTLAYGRWTVRARAERGQGVTMVALLWPGDNRWPPEIDFAEDNGADRRMMSSTAHFADGKRVHHETAIDSTQWHDYAVEWTPGQIKYLIDGRVWATVADARVPGQPMRLALQTEPWVKGTTWFRPVADSTPSQVSVYVDSVRIESLQR
ncbi:glycosyl hydrolase family 16 [Kineococcus xinjiangensis]|uniref:Glycosyl hydrolase family 16 n=1 Tax=Kineococcus xinjiangensis TaxID=512762 RepID=A0A2S6IM15_9ACTN|nr:glycoside hydrolase family 16 protein [Kineococcus xinjiangensis]PPK95215.1 glycosyl hydrolase family 16 [Kineococcus xinjiangensis]